MIDAGGRARELQGMAEAVFAVLFAVLWASGGLWVMWNERDDLGDVVPIGILTLVGVTLLARIASCRVWTRDAASGFATSCAATASPLPRFRRSRSDGPTRASCSATRDPSS
jgi:hypothetical protein